MLEGPARLRALDCSGASDSERPDTVGCCCQSPTLRSPFETGYNRRMRIFWRTLAVVSRVALLLLTAIAIAIRTAAAKEFIGPIQQRVKEATGRDLAVRGGIGLQPRLEPKLGL